VDLGKKNQLSPACEPQLTGCHYDFFGWLFQAEQFILRSQPLNLLYSKVILKIGYKLSRPMDPKSNPVRLRPVVQSGVLSPTLFNIFVNSMFDIQLNGIIQVYADDTAIKYSPSSLVELFDMINEDMTRLKGWFNANS
jgi:hypothetical protein